MDPVWLQEIDSQREANIDFDYLIGNDCLIQSYLENNQQFDRSGLDAAFDRSLSQFKRLNKDDKVLLWNINDLFFMAWMYLVPIKPTCDIQRLIDVRTKVGIMACRHWPLVSGQVYISLDERQTADDVAAAHALREPIGEVVVEAGVDPVDFIAQQDAREHEQRTRARKRKLYQEYEDSENARMHALLTSTRQAPRFNLDTVMSEVATAIVRIWRSDDSLKDVPMALLRHESDRRSDVKEKLAAYDSTKDFNEWFEEVEITGSADLESLREHLSNRARKEQQGWFLSQSVASNSTDWIPVACHVLTHLKLERTLINKFPSVYYPIKEHEMLHEDEARFITRNEIKAFESWVLRRFSLDIPQEIMKEVRDEVCNYYMPAGARTYVRRRSERTFIPFDVICQCTIGTNATAELIAAVDDELKITGIAGNPSHPLFQLIAIVAVSWVSDEDSDNSLAFDTEVLLSNSELLDLHANFSKETVYGAERGPLITFIEGKWRVHHRGKWWLTKENSFSAAWLFWVKTIVRFHKGLTNNQSSVAMEWKDRCNLQWWD